MQKELGVPTPNEVAAAIESYNPGEIPSEVWLSFLRLGSSGTYELTPFRIFEGKVQVRMIRRNADDPVYPNQLHMPGVMINGNDSSLEDAFKRLLKTEISQFEMKAAPELIEAFVRKTPRSTESVFQHLVEVRRIDNRDDQNWYDAENLPSDVIENHKDMVKRALVHIKAKGQKRQTASFE